MIHDLRELVQYRDLLYMLAWRDIKVKYKQTILGFTWAIFMPIMIVSAGLLVRYAFSRLSGTTTGWSDIAGVAVKAVPWAYFVASLRFATLSLLANTNLITKVYFPRVLFPVAAALSQLLDLVLASLALTAVLALAGVGASWQLLWIPVLLAVLVVFVVALALALSALALFFRDVKFIVEVLLTFGIFFTPVLYDADMFGAWANVLLLNPVAPILEGLLACVVHHQPPSLGWLAYSAACSFAALLGSYKLFKSLEPKFAEYI